MFVYMYFHISLPKVHSPQNFSVYWRNAWDDDKVGQEKNKNHVSSFVNICISAVFEQMHRNRFPKLIYASVVHLHFTSLFPKFIKTQKNSFHNST